MVMEWLILLDCFRIPQQYEKFNYCELITAGILYNKLTGLLNSLVLFQKYFGAILNQLMIFLADAPLS